MVNQYSELLFQVRPTGMKLPTAERGGRSECTGGRDGGEEDGRKGRWGQAPINLCLLLRSHRVSFQSLYKLSDDGIF